MLAKTIRQTKSLREARRWQIAQPFAIVDEPPYQHSAYEALPKVEETKEKSEQLFVP